MNNKLYNLIIAILLMVIAVMGWKIYDMKQLSLDKAVECMAKMSKDMPKEEILDCKPALEKLGFKFDPEIYGDS